MSKETTVVNCWEGCPFANIQMHARRIYISCNLQPGTTQYRASGKDHECFNTCPLKNESVTVKLKTDE
jgi:hypothetical protein